MAILKNKHIPITNHPVTINYYTYTAHMVLYCNLLLASITANCIILIVGALEIPDSN